MSEPVDIGGGIVCYQTAECRCASCMILLANAETRRVAQAWAAECSKLRDRIAEADREAAEWRRLHDLNAQARGRLAAAVMLAIGKAEALAHGPMSDDAVAAAVKDAVDSARGRGRFEADATGAVDDVDVMARALGVLARMLDNARAELRAMKGE